MERPSWDKYFMEMAELVSTRATCDRKHVGAVIVKDKRVLSSGYNGSIPGMPHCNEVGHDMENDHCVTTVHAELNSIIQAARFGTSIDGATMYINTHPCFSCLKCIVTAGVKQVVYRDEYKSQDSRIINLVNKIPNFILRKCE
jgi:dCMP deaminase